jgi:hypothetical protein
MNLSPTLGTGSMVFISVKNGTTPIAHENEISRIKKRSLRRSKVEMPFCARRSSSATESFCSLQLSKVHG